MITAVLREAFEHRGISQKELSQTLGVSQQTISAWLKGLTLPKDQKLDALESALGLEPGTLWAARRRSVSSPSDEGDLLDLVEEIGSVPEGRVLDFLTRKAVRDTPEEYVRQNLEKALVRQYRYDPSDCQPDALAHERTGPSRSPTKQQGPWKGCR